MRTNHATNGAFGAAVAARACASHATSPWQVGTNAGAYVIPVTMVPTDPKLRHRRPEVSSP